MSGEVCVNLEMLTKTLLTQCLLLFLIAAGESEGEPEVEEPQITVIKL